MLRSLRELIGCMLVAKDGEIGRCKDFLFDDRNWVIRYLEADTRKWLRGRKVLVSPLSVDLSDWKTQLLSFRVLRDQLKKSPPLDEDAVVSRRYEMTLFDYYGWSYYWNDRAVRKVSPKLSALCLKAREKVLDRETESDRACHLYSIKEVKGYEVHGIDGRLGNAANFIMDDETWALRYLLVDTSYLLPGKMVLLAMDSVKSIDRATMDIRMEAFTEVVDRRPEFKVSDQYKPVISENQCSVISKQ
jgi:hypothetical protein